MNAEEEVRQASDEFYAALNGVFEGNTEPMDNIWSHSPDCIVMHPLSGRRLGWEEVKASWEEIAKSVASGQISSTDLRIRVLGAIAFTICVERGQVEIGDQTVAMNFRATNIYHLENGKWKIIHHHADIDPALQKALERQQS